MFYKRVNLKSLIIENHRSQKIFIKNVLNNLFIVFITIKITGLDNG